MKPAPFRWFAPRSVEEALDLLAEHGEDAKVLAGGQSLVPAMNFRLAQPAVLVDLNRVPELTYVEATSRTPGGPEAGAQAAKAAPRESDAAAGSRRSGAAGPEPCDGPRDAGWAVALRVGAMTRQRTAERSPEVSRIAPLVPRALSFVAHPQIRNRGTVGGSLAHADPAAELPAVALAVDARFLLRGRGGERWIAARDFYTGGLFATALEPGEILAEIAIPRAPPGTGWAFEELSRRHGDFALAGVAARVTLGADRRCASARLALFGVGDGPVSSDRAAALLEGAATDGGSLDAEALGAAAATAARELDPPADIHASSAFRRHLAQVLVGRALDAASRAAWRTCEAPG